jgi:Txe/YoeB family toxin of Txe-Axe toxin-antitoxin module
MNDFVSVVLIANDLKLRCKNIDPKKRKILEEISNYENTVKKLLIRAIKSVFHKKTTLGAENRLLSSVIVTKIYKKYTKFDKKKYANFQTPNVKNKLENITDSIFAIEQKIEPLKFDISEDFKKRINIIIPTVDFKYFFGGYIAKFNFAKKLADLGENVRIIIVDWCDFKPSEWKKEIKNYSGLEKFFDLVEVV